MATQPPQPQPPKNGESINFSIGGKSIGIHAGNLIPILLLIGGIVGGYLIFQALDHRIEALVDGQGQILITLGTNRSALQDALYLQQSAIVQHAAQADTRMTAMEQAHRETAMLAVQAVQSMLRTHEYNQHQEPDQRLPLDLPPGMSEKPKPKP